MTIVSAHTISERIAKNCDIVSVLMRVSSGLIRTSSVARGVVCRSGRREALPQQARHTPTASSTCEPSVEALATGRAA